MISFERIPEPLSPEATAAYPAAGLPRDPSWMGIPTARSSAVAPLAEEALRDLLRRRLRLAFLIVTGVFGVMGCLAIANVALHSAVAPPRVWQGMAFFSVLGAAFAALTALLWSRRPLSVAVLRVVEMALVGLFALGCGWKQASYLDLAPDLARRYGAPGITILAGYHGMFWFALLAIYGLFVPNTWKRCAVVVALIAACPLGLALVHAAGPAREISGNPLLYYLTVLGFWAVFGALLAVFGSQHIEALRLQACEARRVGPYTLGRRLGAGGMGEVYLAEHRLLKRPCAVKLIRPEKAADARELRRFEREVQTTAGLSHPNAVQVYDYGHTPDGSFYYVMEYLPGLSLQELVDRYGPLPPGRAVHFLRQVCGALREAHAAGLIHRDVKPGNVIVGDRGGVPDVAKLLDFGLARDVGEGGAELTRDGAVTGTPAYMAPEQAGGAVLDARVDVYAVGGLAYFLLTGQPPFAGASAMKVIAAHLYEPPTPPSRLRPDVPADVEAVVLRCLAKVPADRFPDASSLDVVLAASECACRWSAAEAAAWWRSHAGADATAGRGGVTTTVA